MFPVDNIKNTEEMEVDLHLSLNKALDGGEQLSVRPGRFTSGNKGWYPLKRETRSATWPDRAYRRRKKYGIRPLDRPASILVDIPSTLPLLR